MRLLNRVGLNYAQQKRFTAEASTFFTATGITDPTQKNAIDYLVKQLKANNLYSKFSVLYPFVGGSADTHKFNLINPVDSDAAFRIAWSGSVTHNANGIKSNGTNGYGDTKYNPVAASASLTSFSMGAYKKGTETAATSRVIIGNQDIPSNNISILGWISSGTTEAGGIGSASILEYAPPVGTPNAQSDGVITINSSGSRVAQLWVNGTKKGTTNTGTANFSNRALYVLANNGNGTIISYALNTVISFLYISSGLSDAEMATLHTIVTAYETMLGRN